MSSDSFDLPAEHVGRLMPLNRLTPAARAVLFEDSHRLSFEANGLVQAKGEHGDTLDFLIAGRVELAAGDSLRREVAGADEAALHPLDAGNPKSYTVVALERSVVLRVPRSGLQHLLQFSGDESADAAAASGTAPWMERMLEPEFFARLPVDNLQQVFRRMRRVEAVAGETLVRPGKRGDGFYVVVSGTATLTQSNERERVARLAELGPGESFGEDLLIADNPCGVRVTMRTDGVLMRLDRDDFVSLVWGALVERLTLDEASRIVAQGAVWLDVRTARAYHEGSLPGAKHLPLTDLRASEPELAKGPHYVVVCDDVERCGLAAFILARRGHVVSFVNEVPDFANSGFAEAVLGGAYTPDSNLEHNTDGEAMDRVASIDQTERFAMSASATKEVEQETDDGLETSRQLDGGDTITQSQLAELVADDAELEVELADSPTSDADDDPGTQNDSLGDTIIGRSLADLLDEMDEFGKQIKPDDALAAETDAIDTQSLLGPDDTLGASEVAAVAAGIPTEDGIDASIPVPSVRADQVDMQTLLHAVQRQMTVFLAAERSRIRAEVENDLERRVAARTEKLKATAREQVREKFSRLQDGYRQRQGEREEALRRSYEKLMRLARQVRSQKVEIQQTKRELEEKLGQASALHRQVDEIRGLLSTRIEKLAVHDESNGKPPQAAEG